MSTLGRICIAALMTGLAGLGQQLSISPALLAANQWTALRNESNGAAPYENLRYLARLHRVPATPEFAQAAAFILSRAREYALTDAHSEEFPIDGEKRYGLMRSYLGWTVEEGSLWEVRPQHILIGDWATDPIRLADYSRSAGVETELVDVGNGATENDYARVDVRGKIVLADGILARVQALAVTEHGAAGILSDMPNQTTAWSGLDTTLVRWGHLDARQPAGFAFMVSRQAAEALRTRLRAGEHIVLNAHVKAQVGPGHWTVVSATIPGADPSAGEIVYSCHLDHERPGANDNASGCVTILECARMLAHLISSGQLSRPKRGLRFIWGPEVEGTMAYLATHPDIRARMHADIHMDMVGGDPFKNKSVFHLTSTPWSLPSFVTDLGAEFLAAIREGASAYAEGEGSVDDAVIETRAGANGTRNEWIADVTPYANGSDHDVYDSSTVAIPSLYLRDWPDIYIHTDHDTLDQIDATKLRRAALLGAASGYLYASLAPRDVTTFAPFLTARAEARLAQAFVEAQRLVEDSRLETGAAWYEARNLMAQSLRRETAMLESFAEFAGAPVDAVAPDAKALTEQAARYQTSLDTAARSRGAVVPAPGAPWSADPDAGRVPERIGDFGPLTYQNDNVLLARLGPVRYAKIKLINPDASGLLNTRDQSELYAYEIVNFVDGKRSVGEIRDAVSAEYGPLALHLVADYLGACAEAGIIRWK